MQYIYGKYGRERAGIAATVITYRTRSAVREVGKVFGLSEDTVGALAAHHLGLVVGRRARTPTSAAPASIPTRRRCARCCASARRS